VEVAFEHGPREVTHFEHAGVALWGVTASILRDLAERAAGDGAQGRGARP
jgi:hypothetical protein